MNNPFETIDARLSNIENLLLDLMHRQIPAVQEEQTDLLDIKSAAKMLSLSVATLYSKISRREIPYIKRQGSKRVYFSRAALLLWLEEGKKATKKEIEKAAKKSLSKR